MPLSISVIAGIIPMLSWGIADFLQSTVIRKIGTLKAIFLSNLVWTLLLIPFAFFVDLNIAISNFLLLIVGALIAVIAIYNYFQSMKIGEISIVVPISATYPLVTTTLLILFLGHTFNKITLLAILILIIGVILTSTDLRKLKHIHTVRGVKESFIAAVLWGVYYYFFELAAKDITFIFHFPQTSAMTLFFYSSLLMGIGLVIFAILKKSTMKFKEIKNTKVLPLIMLLQAMYLATWMVVSYGLAKGNTAIVIAIGSLYPAIAVILALIFYKEKLVLNQKIGIITVLLGLFLISM